MAIPPPPFSNIAGTSAIVGKYNQQENLANADGNARPGQLVINLETDPPTVYIGNNLGNLSLVGGSGYSGISGYTGTSGYTGISGYSGASGVGINTVSPNALSSTVHIAANIVGTTLNLFTDATTANTANTIVVRDANGAINVSGWTVGTHLTAVNYTATNSDYWIGTTTKNKTITLPNAANGASTGRQYQVADVVHAGNPGTTIAAQSPDTVTGNQPSQQGQIITCTYIGGVWYLN